MILELEHIYKDYMQGSMEVHILKDISLAVEEGQYLAIMGPSGSGKTTLMNIIGCLDKPTSGTYHLNGEDVLSYPITSSRIHGCTISVLSSRAFICCQNRRPWKMSIYH